MTEETVFSEIDAAWLPRPNRVRWILADALPSGAPITAAYALTFQNNRVLVARHKTRGWDIVGGHVEPDDESPRWTAIRETDEETGVMIYNTRLFAYQHIELLGEKPADYKYPHPASYQLLYLADVMFAPEDDDFIVDDEDMVERAFWTYQQAVDALPWASKHRLLFDKAWESKHSA